VARSDDSQVTDKTPSIHLESYGCSASLSDSEIVKGILSDAKFHVERHGDIHSQYTSPDLNIIITCTVKTATEQRMLHRIRELSKTGKPLIVAGCLPKNEKEIIEKLDPSASMIGPRSLEKTLDVVHGSLNGKRILRLEDDLRPKLLLPKVRTSKVIDVIQVATGCLSHCSFCATKLAKGHLSSFSPKMVVKQVQTAVNTGYKEIWLTSTDNGPYGHDIGTNMAYLVTAVTHSKGDFLIRVGMMNPLFIMKIHHNLIEAYRSPKVFKFLHLPVQSGSDEILRSMSRGHNAEDFLDIVSAFRNKFPKIALSTDIIVGFPGETEEDFESSVNLLKTVHPDTVNLSRFSPRMGTRAAKMVQVRPEIIKERTQSLHKIVRAISQKQNDQWLGYEGSVLIDEKVRGGFIGRNFAYKPVFLQLSSRDMLGMKVKVKVMSTSSNCLIGTVKNEDCVKTDSASVKPFQSHGN